MAMDVVRSRPGTASGPADKFTGTVWIDQVAFAAAPSRIRVNSVHFTPGARSAWHTHPNGQVLHVMEGVGRVQERGGPVHEIRAGDTVVTGPGEWHWHGAAPENFMTHLVVHESDEDGNDASWGEHVTDPEYLTFPG
jgi:quercetin dioxygenase-like cupin family protein